MKSKYRIALASAAIAALGVIATPALAEKVVYAPAAYVAATTTDEIVVVPYGPYRERTGRSSTGMPEETIHVSRVVTARDLDLRYDASVSELYRRIEYTAREACDEADRASRGVSLTSDRQCVRDAIRGAEPQVEALIYRARY